MAAQARMNVHEMMGRNLKTFNLKFKATLSLGFKLLLHTLQVAMWILVTVIAELYIIRKMQSSFFPKENLIHQDHTLPHYIHILFIHCTAFKFQLKSCQQYDCQRRSLKTSFTMAVLWQSFAKVSNKSLYLFHHTFWQSLAVLSGMSYISCR